MTLHHWQQLAQPHLGGILDSRPGVLTKGFRPLEVDAEEEVYQFTDIEEDEPGDRRFASLSTSAATRPPCSSRPGSASSHGHNAGNPQASGERPTPGRPASPPHSTQDPPESPATSAKASGEGAP